MGQFLPEVRGVFKLIELHKKDLERSLRSRGSLSTKGKERTKPRKSNAVEN